MQDQGAEFSGVKHGHVALDKLTDASWKRIAFEAQVLDELLGRKRTKERVALATAALGWSRAKLYRKLSRYRDAGHALALVSRASDGGERKSRLTAKQDEILEATLKKFLRKRRGQPVSHFVELALSAFETAEVGAPAPRTISRRFDALTQRVKDAHRLGAAKASEKYNLILGQTPAASFPLERIQIDHTDADVWLMSDDLSVPLGRPTVTLVIDEFSRIVLAIHVTFGYPSINELAEAMAIACLPKEGWLKSMGLEGIDWPWFGVPAAVFVDCGVDFTSGQFNRACMKWRINLSHRPQPHHGGIIERAIGTAMQKTRLLPGSALHSKKSRKEDRVDPSKTAKLTLNQYLAELVQFFVCEYPNRIHPYLGMTPAEKWNLGVHQYGDPKKTLDPEKFYLDFIKGATRTLQKYGVDVSYLKYTDRKLQTLVNVGKSVEVQVKRDPADVSRAFIEDPRDGSYIEVFNHLTRNQGITLAEWEAARASLRKQTANGALSEEGILAHIRRNRSAREGTVSLSNAGSRSKLVRASKRKEAHEQEKRVRSANRLRGKSKPAEISAPVTVDPERFKFYD